MNWDQIEGNFKQFSGKMQKEFGKLTNDDIAVAKGNREQLTGRIQERYGYEKEKAQEALDGFIAKL